jgi:hypothetical protein
MLSRFLPAKKIILALPHFLGMGYGAQPHDKERPLTFAVLVPVAGIWGLPHGYEKPLTFALCLFSGR